MLLSNVKSVPRCKYGMDVQINMTSLGHRSYMLQNLVKSGAGLRLEPQTFFFYR